jgi:putative ABC transport system permease protein
VERADNLIVWFMQVALPNGSQEGILAYALEDPVAWNLPWRVHEGELSDLRRGAYFFLDESAARRFGPFAVGEHREIAGQRLRIIGRTAEARSFTTTPIAFMDLRRAQALDPGSLGGQTTYVLVRLAPGADRAAVAAEIRRRLPYNDVFTAEEFAARSRDYWVANTGIGLNMYLTVFLGCLVGVVVVAQTLYTSTMEHLKEFGTVKAIGGGNGHIYRILGEQAAIAAVVGFAVGVVPAYLLRPVVAAADLKLILTPQMAAVVFAGTLVLCLAASMASFRKAARIDPALVFRA